jgi:hypothetical protein
VRTFRDENVSVNLHHLRLRQSSALMQVVHVLSDEQEFTYTLCQSGNRLMPGIGPRIANMPASLAILLPN